MAYGDLGSIGIGTPQANPTVEPEFGILLPRRCALYVTRLTSGNADPRARLEEYFRELPRYLRAFDTLKPDVFGFACTSSAYFIGAEAEMAACRRIEREFGFPIETSTTAIRWAFERLGARRLVLLVPYPESFIAPMVEYWQAAGFEVSAAVRIPTRTADTRTIYELSPEDLGRALAALPVDRADAVLIGGTGLPSLAAIAAGSLPVPVVSSNFCLAARLLDRLGAPGLLEHGVQPIGWRERLREALGRPS